MAHQLSCDDEHSDGTINQYYRRYFLGHVGEVELGASALAGIYYLAVYMLGFGFSIGLQVMIARRNGEQHYKETGRTFSGSIFPVGDGSHSLPIAPFGFSLDPVPVDNFG